MDTEFIKQLATDMNNAIVASTNPLYQKIAGLQTEKAELKAEIERLKEMLKNYGCCPQRLETK